MSIADIRYNILKRFAGDKVVEPTPKDIRNSVFKSTAIGLAVGPLARLAFKKFAPKNLTMFKTKLIFGGASGIQKRIVPHDYKIITPGLIAGDAAAGTIYGLYQHDIKNAIARSNADPSKKPEAINKIKEMHGFLKKAAFWGALAGAARGIGSVGKGIGYGLLPMGKGKFSTGVRKSFGFTNTPTLSHKAFGLAVKGGAGYGLYRGGKAVYDTVKRNTDTGAGEYTTMLRNNMLSGNIQPNELSVEDMESVRQRGMR